MPDGYIQRNRVVATAGVGMKYLAREDAETAGLLGTGMMAGGYVEVIRAVRPGVKRIKVYSPNVSHREEFARHWSGLLEIEIIPVDSEEEAVRDTDIVVGATNLFTPVLKGEWVRPGAHMVSTTHLEMDEECYRRADILMDTWGSQGENAWDVIDYVLPAAPESHVKLGGMQPDLMKLKKQTAQVYDLADLLAGSKEGRAAPDQITFHVNHSAGVQFAALGGLIYHKSQEKGLGHEVPTDWFMEELHP